MSTPVQPPVPTRGGGPSPELVGGLVVLVTLALAATTLLGRGTAPSGSADPSSIPSTAAVPTATRIMLVDPAVADLLLSLDGQLLEDGDRLTAELAREPFRAAEVSTILRAINVSARFGVDAVTSLGTTAAALDMIERLGGIYGSLREIAVATLRASITNPAAYRTGAERVVEAVAPLPALQDALEVLRAGLPPPTPTPPASQGATPVPSPSGPPSPTPTLAPPSPSPTQAAPSTSASPAVLGPSQIVDGGFESGVGPPWELRLEPSAGATLTADRQIRAGGVQSARVDIVEPTVAFGGVTVRQPGLRLEAGGRYTVRIALRATELREVRVHLVSQVGQTYLTRVATAGPTWSVATFTFTAPVSDTDAVLEVGLGRTAVTTWLDDVWLSTGSTATP